MMTKGKKFASHKKINVDHLRDNAHIYPGVYDALGRLGIIPFYQFTHKYNEDLVMQFFAMVYFHNDDVRTPTRVSARVYLCLCIHVQNSKEKSKMGIRKALRI